MTQTPFQPDLPPEETFTDAEFSFMEESPPGLFPENQDSNFGYVIRRVFSNFIQDLANEQMTLYNERFVETSTDYLDQWEMEVGLPVNPSGITLDQQRLTVLNRLRRGPFTRDRRDALIASYLQASYGTPIILTPSGVPLSSGGVPIYGEGFLASRTGISPNGTPVLDNFNRANGDAGANWTPNGGLNPQIVSNQVVHSAGPQPLRSYFSYASFSEPCEVFLTIVAPTSVSDFEFGFQPTGNPSVGYAIYCDNHSKIYLVKYDPNYNPLASASLTLAAGNKLGLSVDHGHLTAWYWNGTNWSAILTATDPDPIFSGPYTPWLFVINGDTMTLDDWGGGTYNITPHNLGTYYNYNRANGPAGANYTPVGVGSVVPQISGNKIVHNHTDPLMQWQYNPISLSASCEVCITFLTSPTGGGGDTELGFTTIADPTIGYAIFWDNAPGSVWNGTHLTKYGSTGWSNWQSLGGLPGVLPQSGERWGLSLEPHGDLKIWRDSGDGNGWQVVFHTVDPSPIAGPFRFFMDSADTVQLDDLGGGTYIPLFYVAEDQSLFSYTVYISNAVSVNTTSLTRELKRITPAGISFTIARF